MAKLSSSVSPRWPFPSAYTSNIRAPVNQWPVACSSSRKTPTRAER